MKLFIGCSSSNDIPKDYLSDCENYLNVLLEDNDIVFGACNSGLMGLSYNIAKKNDNKVTGICPVSYKDKVIECADALVFLPGGIGTIYELFTAIESKRSHEFDKPIVIYNSNHYFDKLLEFLETMYDQRFTATKVKDCYYVSSSPEDTLEYLNNYKGLNLIKKC